MNIWLQKYWKMQDRGIIEFNEEFQNLRERVFLRSSTGRADYRNHAALKNRAFDNDNFVSIIVSVTRYPTDHQKATWSCDLNGHGL